MFTLLVYLLQIVAYESRSELWSRGRTLRTHLESRFISVWHSVWLVLQLIADPFWYLLHLQDGAKLQGDEVLVSCCIVLNETVPSHLQSWQSRTAWLRVCVTICTEMHLVL